MCPYDPIWATAVLNKFLLEVKIYALGLLKEYPKLTKLRTNWFCEFPRMRIHNVLYTKLNKNEQLIHFSSIFKEIEHIKVIMTSSFHPKNNFYIIKKYLLLKSHLFHCNVERLITLKKILHVYPKNCLIKGAISME